MNRRWVIIGIIILGAVMAGAIIWLAIFNQPTEPETPQEPEEQQEEATGSLGRSNGTSNGATNRIQPNTGEANVEDVEVPSSAGDRVTIERMAKVFAAKYGSYSNQSDLDGIRGLKSMSTDTMDGFIDQYIEEVSRELGQEEYRGVSSRPVSFSFTEFREEDGVAVATVTLQREHFEGSTANGEIDYEELRIEFVKQGDQWAVDNASWVNTGAEG